VDMSTSVHPVAMPLHLTFGKYDRSD